MNSLDSKANKTILLEAEDMALTGAYKVESNQFASGGKVISLHGGDNNDTGAANFEFGGATGKYDLKVTYFDEDDGVGQIKIKQDSLTLKSFQLNQELGSAVADEETKTTLKIEELQINKGDNFEIEGIEQGSEWTAEHTRIDKIEFIPQETTATPTTQSKETTTIKPVEVEVEFEVNNQKNGEFDGNISFTNNGKQFQGWTASFDAKFKIDEIRDAKIVSRQGDRYVIEDVSSNDNVYAGETTTFGFSANGETITPSNFVFNGQAIDVEVEEEIESTPSSPSPAPTSISPSPTISPTPSPTSISRPNYNKSEGFFTLDGKLYDANGNEFIPRGINNLHIYYDDNNDNNNQAYDALDNIASFGFNSVRIVWEVDFLDRPTNDDMLEKIIQRTIDLNMVPVVEIHDFTGSTDKQALLNKGVKWWTDRAALWQKYEKYLIIDIANEFGNHAMAYQGNRRAFPDIYKEAITRMRNAGIDNTLVVEPFEWAKDYTLIRDYGQEIYHHDPQKKRAV